MNEMTLLPADIAEMSVAQLRDLPPLQKYEIDKNIDEAITWLKRIRSKFDAALMQRYSNQAQQVLRDTGVDVGTVHLTDGPLHIKVEIPKKISWDLTLLNEMAERIDASGERVSDYIDVKLSVAESRFKHWPPALRVQFETARTVVPGKPTFQLALVGEV